MECPLYEDERNTMWNRLKSIRRDTKYRVLIDNKRAAVAITQFIIDTQVLQQFRDTDPLALGTYENNNADTSESEQETGVSTRSIEHAGEVSPRSAMTPVRTTPDITHTSFGSRTSGEPTGESALRGVDENECANG
ncbi:uncharacterized protein BHQ10_010388 [Talaromyces amestolkiae]|uniref:Uncharacterized protein n=1 Tax=Talaromyces amestolkiae TaxID=1196081 RepID=A0A364LEX6_TALAM|nr:uncharacterized protein BHQ10_010388 [Talaromyces amestolkiae]RAO74376.1 hypothetical protein BHQ10_010388 [Talaromyces amestolkiae]